MPRLTGCSESSAWGTLTAVNIYVEKAALKFHLKKPGKE